MAGVIHGTALLASSMMLGRWLGALLAQALGIDADMGGVGFAMVVLMLAMTVMRRFDLVTPAFETGIGYWAAVYIPIVVAMAATQNVVGAALRDLAIVATAFSARLDELARAGLRGAIALVLGVLGSFALGALCGYVAGYRDPVDLATIGGGAATYIVGPMTGAALGAGSAVIAIAVAAGLVKAILVMLVAPTVASWIGLNRPQAALVFGGLLGTTSGVVAGLAATDQRLVPYGALTSTFYTGLGCVLGPSLVISVLRMLG
jgi:malonate transporter MadM subunit